MRAVSAPPTEFNFAQHLIAANAGRSDKVALIDDMGRITYGQLAEQVRRFADSLKALGLRRAERVLLRAMDLSVNPYELWMEGFEAIVAQHEVDHLDGFLFLDRVANLKTDVFRRKNYS